MSAGSFKQDSLGWRIDLIKQRVSEWIEFKTSQIDTESWDWDLDGVPWKIIWTIIKFCLWTIIAVLLVWMTWQLWLLWRRSWNRWQRQDKHHSPSKTPPGSPKLSSANWIEKSQSARVEGNYRQAIFCLYQAMLQLLDEREIIPAQLSLTDGEYKRSLSKLSVSSPQSYELLLSIHQRLCFSKAEADRSLFEQCQQAYQQIEISPQ